MRNLTLLSVFFISPFMNAQPEVHSDGLFVFPQYAMIIISGVLLALLFQVIFIILSVCFGISSVGDLRKKFVKASNHTGDQDDKELEKKYKFDQDHESDSPHTGEKISTMFGVWCTVTTSLALFIGTMLALNLATISTIGINITLALVIWAIFFLILFYIEVKLAQSIVGGLFSTVINGIKLTTNSLTGIFKTSEPAKMEDVIDHSIEKFRKEVLPDFDSDKIAGVLNKFLNKVDDKIPEYETLKQDVEKMAQDNSSKNNSAKWGAIQQILTKFISENPQDKSDKTGTLKKWFDEIQEDVKKEGSVSDGAKQMVADKTDRSKEDGDNALSGFWNFIKEATPENLNLENIVSEFKKILSGDESIGDILSENTDVNREEIVAMLNKNTGLKKDRIEEYADKIESAFKSIKNSFSAEGLEDFKNEVEQKIKNFLNMDDGQSLDPAKLKTEFFHLINNPSETLSNIKSSITSFKIEDFENFLLRNDLVTEDKLETITSSYNDALGEMKDKVDQIEMRAHQEWEMTKRKAVINAEHARKTAAIAAWWLLATVLVSGCVSVLGIYTF